MKRAVPKILIIDDEPHIIGVLEVVLGDANFEVISASNGSDGLRSAYDQHPDLILLDISMPDLDGFQVLDNLRLVTDVPVILLTGMGQDENRVRGMNKGAADFLPKGMSTEALLAHINARLRTPAQVRKPQGPRHFGDDLVVDVSRRRVHVGNKSVSLTPLQWRLFEYLVQNEGQIATYRKLLAAGWDHPATGTERSVKVQISLLRGKLNDPPYDSRYIHTIREEGYLFEVRTNGL